MLIKTPTPNNAKLIATKSPRATPKDAERAFFFPFFNAREIMKNIVGPGMIKTTIEADTNASQTPESIDFFPN